MRHLDALRVRTAALIVWLMKTSPLFSLCGLAVLTSTLTACDADEEKQSIQIELSASVADEAFECGKNYDALGGQSPADLRFYVSEVHLLTREGDAVALNLDEGTEFQDGQVALIDFENGKKGCQGDELLNDMITGTVAPGDYTGIEFKVGVPAAMNHSNPADYPSLLQSPGMAWSWLLGFKHFKAEVGESEGAFSLLHLGSTGCSRESDDADHQNHDEKHEKHDGTDHEKHDGTDHEKHDDADHEKHDDADHEKHDDADHEKHDDADHQHAHHSTSEHTHGDSGAQTTLPTCQQSNRLQVRLDDYKVGESKIQLDFAKIFGALDLSQAQVCHASETEDSCALTMVGKTVKNTAAMNPHRSMGIVPSLVGWLGRRH